MMPVGNLVDRRIEGGAARAIGDPGLAQGPRHGVPAGWFPLPRVTQEGHPGRLRITFRPQLGGAMRQNQFDLRHREALAHFVHDALGTAGKAHEDRAMNRVENDCAGFDPAFPLSGVPHRRRPGAAGVVPGLHHQAVGGQYDRRIPEGTEAGDARQLGLIENEALRPTSLPAPGRDQSQEHGQDGPRSGARGMVTKVELHTDRSTGS